MSVLLLENKMTITVPVIYKAGMLQIMEDVKFPENLQMQATLDFDSNIVAAPNVRTAEERIKAFDALVERLSSRNVKPLPESAFDRESFYED